VISIPGWHFLAGFGADMLDVLREKALVELLHALEVGCDSCRTCYCCLLLLCFSALNLLLVRFCCSRILFGVFACLVSSVVMQGYALMAARLVYTPAS